jgi:hypothetical protein
MQILFAKGKSHSTSSWRGRRGEEAAASNKDFIPEIPHNGLTSVLV